MITLATGAIIYDGLSQTQIYFDLFGGADLFGPADPARHLGRLRIHVRARPARPAGIAAAERGGPVRRPAPRCRRLPDRSPPDVPARRRQRIIAAINDPLLRDNLLPLDLAFHEPVAFLTAAVVWSIQLASVVGGHVVGAWAGHAALADDAALAKDPDLDEGTTRSRLLAQLPLAALMVALTSLTLWSLGQAVLIPPAT